MTESVCKACPLNFEAFEENVLLGEFNKVEALILRQTAWERMQEPNWETERAQ